MSLLLAAGGGAAAHTIDCAGNGILTTTAFGSHGVSVSLQASGVLTSTAFGTQSIAARLAANGISTSSVFGTASLSANLNANGVVTSTDFGSATVSPQQVHCVLKKRRGRVHVLYDEYYEGLPRPEDQLPLVAKSDLPDSKEFEPQLDKFVAHAVSISERERLSKINSEEEELITILLLAA